MLAGWMNRHQQMAIEYLMEENKVLKELHGDKRLNFTNEQRKRLARKGRKLGLNGLRKVATLVTPETILSWHRKLIALKYTAKRTTSPLRKSQQEVRRMVVRIALENPTWGYSRIVGALQNLGVKRSKTTIANILQKEGIKPTPERHHLDWNGFLKSHWDVLCATDFFTTEVWTWKGLVRYHVHFIIEVATRKVRITHISCQWNESIILNVFRGLLDGIDGDLLNKRYLIMDRDPLFTKALRRLLKSCGVNPLRYRPGEPLMNIYAERFVKSIKHECVNRLIFVGEESLRKAINEYATHYNEERNHQGIENKPSQRIF
jgi:transposase InsO family protein